jgi:hypothetical protein
VPNYWRARAFNQDYWCIEADDGERTIVSDNGPPTEFDIPADGSADGAFEQIFAGPESEPRIGRCELGPAEYYPRIWRGPDSPPPREVYLLEWTETSNAANALFAQMREIFRFVEPRGPHVSGHPGNLSTYGHEIRQLLVLACIEVESAWKAILRASDASRFSGRLSTSDYLKVCAPLRLDEWEIAVPLCPHVAPFRPFEGWQGSAPTQSLDWYNAFANVRNDRESSFHEATLLRMIQAMGAVFVMMCAQFGAWWLPEARSSHSTPMFMQTVGFQRHAFLITQQPAWSHGELYVPAKIAGRANMPYIRRAYPFP